MPQSLRDRYIAGFIAAGFTEVAQGSRKYRCFTKDGARRYFVGKSGAVRVGPLATKSVPVTEQFKRSLLRVAAQGV